VGLITMGIRLGWISFHFRPTKLYYLIMGARLMPDSYGLMMAEIRFKWFFDLISNFFPSPTRPPSHLSFLGNFILTS
jgi:hypothetical protein